MANKKINQLVSKTAILSTDLFGIGDATTGQLFKKTIAELQAAIGGAVISVNGLVGTVVLDTDDIQELATPTNKYFTDARARGAISLTVTGNSGASTYSSGTGVLNVPTYTLAGLGGITASFLSGTSGISYNSTTGVISYSGTVYTDSSIRALLSGGTGITYNSSTGAISYSGTVYTDSSVRALISITTTGTSGASTYNNTTGVINVPEYTLAGLGGISLTSLSGGTGITYNNTTGAISYSGTVYTDASVRALISATGSVSYNNTTGVISLSGGNLTEATSSVLTITGGIGAVIGGGTSIQVNQASTSVSGFLSSTDWTTFNNKQATITLTTTGTSGAATLTSGTLNIPQYAAALSGTTNYLAKFTSTTAIGVSKIFDNGSNLSINSASPITTNLVGALTIVKTYNSDTPASTTAQNYNGNQSGLYVFGRNSGISLIGGNGENNHIIFGNTSAAAFARIYTDNGTTAAGGNMYFNVGTDTTRMTITAAGIVGIGIVPSTWYSLSKGMQFGDGGGLFCTSANNLALTGNELLDASANQRYIAADFATRYQQNAGKHVWAFASAGTAGNIISYTEVFRTTTSANMLIGTTSDNGERLYVSGAIRATGSITANSDISLKKNLLKIENALEKVEQINGYTYEFKEDDSKRHAGVIAQEIQTVLPEIVNKGNDGILGVEYGNISALLIEAIKEQQTQIKELKALLNK